MPDSYVHIDSVDQRPYSTDVAIMHTLDNIFSELYSYGLMRLNEGFEKFKQSRIFMQLEDLIDFQMRC